MTKKGKTIQLQSPENYIRTRARNLEVFECFINPGWKESGIANVVVARKHTNGNITVAIYLVDLYCLGVKDTMYLFNVSEPEYRDKLMPFDNDKPFIEIEYKLAHNIIFAAVEFAGDFGFNPHKDFTSITQYLLEEDTDDIELIDIECGMDGKPAYFQGEFDSNATVTRILNQLERTAGKGNYHFTILDKYSGIKPGSDSVSEDDDFDDDEYEDRMSYEEAVTTFRKYKENLESLDKQEVSLFFEALEVLFNSLIDDDKYDMYYDQFFDDLDIEIVIDEIPEEMMGISLSEIHDPDKFENKLKPILELPDKKFKKGIKMVEKLKIEYGDIPLLASLELFLCDEKASEGFREKLFLYREKYPDYPMIRIASLLHSFLSNLDKTNEAEIIPLQDLFQRRNSIHGFELQQYLVYAAFVTLLGSDNSRVAAFQQALVDMDYPFGIGEAFLGLLIEKKITIVDGLIEDKGV